MVLHSPYEGFDIPRKIKLTASLVSRSPQPHLEFAKLLSKHYSDGRDWEKILEVSRWKPNHVSWFSGVEKVQASTEWWLLRNDRGDSTFLNHLVLVTGPNFQEDNVSTIELINKINALIVENHLVSGPQEMDPLDYMKKLNDLLDKETGQL